MNGSWIEVLENPFSTFYCLNCQNNLNSLPSLPPQPHVLLHKHAGPEAQRPGGRPSSSGSASGGTAAPVGEESDSCTSGHHLVLGEVKTAKCGPCLAGKPPEYCDVGFLPEP